MKLSILRLLQNDIAVQVSPRQVGIKIIQQSLIVIQMTVQKIISSAPIANTPVMLLHNLRMRQCLVWLFCR